MVCAGTVEGFWRDLAVVNLLVNVMVCGLVITEREERFSGMAL